MNLVITQLYIRMFIVACSTVLLVLSACSNHTSGLTSEFAKTSASQQELPVTGKVVDAIQAGGYTYMELSHNGSRFWIASRIIRVQTNDTVSWDSPTLVLDYTSFALNREFAKIYFVKNIRVDQ